MKVIQQGKYPYLKVLCVLAVVSSTTYNWLVSSHDCNMAEKMTKI